MTLSSEHSNSMERTRDRFRETEALFHGRHPGASTHRLGRACPAHCYPVDNHEQSLSPPRSRKRKAPGAQYSFGKAQRVVAQRYLMSHNGMTLSPREVEKHKLPGPGQYDTVHAADSGDAFPAQLSPSLSSITFKDMKDGLRKRPDELTSKLSPTFGKAPRTINFANIRPAHVVLDAQLISDLANEFDHQACIQNEA